MSSQQQPGPNTPPAIEGMRPGRAKGARGSEEKEWEASEARERCKVALIGFVPCRRRRMALECLVGEEEMQSDRREGITVPKDPKGDYAFKQFVKREFEAASKSLGAPSLRTADRNPLGSLAFLVACAAGFDKDSVVDHQLKEGLAGKPVMPLLLVDHMAFTNFKLYFRLTDLYRQVTGEKEPFKELMASNHTELMLQFREVLMKDCKTFGWEKINNVRVCGMQGATMARNG
ncbi:hypothetical protein V8C86DRAFT_3135155 [Haematococcus lacustris]